MGKANNCFSHVFNSIYTSCRTNKVKLEEKTAWFGKLPGVEDREMKTSPGSIPSL